MDLGHTAITTNAGKNKNKNCIYDILPKTKWQMENGEWEKYSDPNIKVEYAFKDVTLEWCSLWNAIIVVFFVVKLKSCSNSNCIKYNKDFDGCTLHALNVEWKPIRRNCVRCSSQDDLLLYRFSTVCSAHKTNQNKTKTIWSKSNECKTRMISCGMTKNEITIFVCGIDAETSL